MQCHVGCDNCGMALTTEDQELVDDFRQQHEECGNLREVREMLEDVTCPISNQMERDWLYEFAGAVVRAARRGCHVLPENPSVE